jgi:pyridoxal phosphate enzyme (YggS family)
MNNSLNSLSHDEDKIKIGLIEVKKRVQDALLMAERNPEETSILAVSKKQPPAAVEALSRMGHIDFGENFLQDALEKIGGLKHLKINWHFIGKIQSNKTREIAEKFQWAHTIDRLKIAECLNRYRPRQLPKLNVCIQVNQANEAQKGGIEPNNVAKLAYEIMELPRLRLRGLMTIPPLNKSLDEAKSFFSVLRSQQKKLISEGISMDTLSMGMSSDLEEAILNGSTIVRIGTAIFGPRLEKNTTLPSYINDNKTP